jgi:YidC/Oxa1 family membrane protein insertase
VTFTPTSFQDPQKNPNEWGNIILFIVLSLVMWMAFDTYVMKPQQVALQAAHKSAAAPTAAAVSLPPRARAEVVADSTRVNLQNREVSATIPVARARLDDVVFKNYFVDVKKSAPVTLLQPPGVAKPTFTDTGWVSDDTALELPSDKSVWSPMVGANYSGNTAAFTWRNQTGLTFVREITLDDQFMFRVIDRVRNESKATVHLAPYALLMQQGVPDDTHGGIVHEGAIGYIGEKLIEDTYGNWADLVARPATYTAQDGWVGVTSRYFFAGLVPAQGQDQTFRVAYFPPENPGDKSSLPRFQVDVQGPVQTLAPGAEISSTVHIYAGAKVLGVLDGYEKTLGLKHFDLTVDFGWFYFLTKPFYYALTFLYHFVGNFGAAIILLTCALRLAVFPLANTSFKSFAKMKKVAPQVKELQQTYIKDKQKMQEELVKLYQKEKVNPLSGCLPILAQIPIFFAMYKVINVAIEMRHAPFVGWIHDLAAPDPTSLFNLFGLLPYDVPSLLNFGVWPCVLFALIMVQVRLSPPPPDPMMKLFFAYYYPVLIAFTMAHFAAGLVIYWATSSFLSLVQQVAIMRMQGVPIHLFGEVEEPASGEPIEGKAVEVVETDDPKVIKLPEKVWTKKK